jgi:hypothetical protein
MHFKKIVSILNSKNVRANTQLRIFFLSAIQKYNGSATCHARMWSLNEDFCEKLMMRMKLIYLEVPTDGMKKIA